MIRKNKNVVSNYYVAYKSGILCDKKNDCLKKRGRIKTSL